MAGNLPVPLGVEVKLVWNLAAGASAINVLHYQMTTPAAINQTKADAIGAIFRTNFTSSGLGAMIWTGVSLGQVLVRDMRLNTDPWYTSAGAAVPGTSASNPLPAATSFVISLSTGKRGRSFNGRVYLWGWTEDANDAAGGASLAAANAGSAFIGATFVAMRDTQQLAMAVLSRFRTIPPATAAIELNPPELTTITGSAYKDQRWDVQRRRATPGI